MPDAIATGGGPLSQEEEDFRRISLKQTNNGCDPLSAVGPREGERGGSLQSKHVSERGKFEPPVPLADKRASLGRCGRKDKSSTLPSSNCVIRESLRAVTAEKVELSVWKERRRACEKKTSHQRKTRWDPGKRRDLACKSPATHSTSYLRVPCRGEFLTESKEKKAGWVLRTLRKRGLSSLAAVQGSGRGLSP